MEHDDVVEQDVVSRYLSGGLPRDERAAFEEHFIDCPSCLDALEGADELQRGLKAVAAQDAMTERIQPIPRSRSVGRAMVFAAGIAAAIAIAVGTVDVLRTRRELARVSRVAADLNGQSDRAQSLIRSLSERVQQLESVTGRGAAAPAAAQASAPVFALTTVRGGGTSTPPNRVMLAGTPEWIVLSLELDDPNAADRYRATLKNAEQREVWRDDHLTASTPETLGIALRATLLDEGDFSLVIDRQTPQATAWLPAGRYAFRVVKSR
jgi:anti-sigma factor RsiW